MPWASCDKYEHLKAFKLMKVSGRIGREIQKMGYFKEFVELRGLKINLEIIFLNRKRQKKGSPKLEDN